MKITCISMSVIPSFLMAADTLAKTYHLDLDIVHYHLYQIDHAGIEESSIVARLRASDGVILDIRGRGRSGTLAMEALSSFSGSCIEMKGLGSPLFSLARLGSFSGSEFLGENEEKRDGRKDQAPSFSRIPRQIQMGSAELRYHDDLENYRACLDYWRYGGFENHQGLLLLLLKRYHGFSSLPEPEPPIVHPESAIFHPDLGYFTILDEYCRAIDYSPDKLTLGILFHGGMHIEQNIPSVSALIRSFHEWNVIPVYSPPDKTLQAISEYLMRGEHPLVDALVNLKWFRINGGPMGGDPTLTRDLLKRINVPVFSPVSLFAQEITEWEESVAGVSPHTAIISVIWPELDGCIEPIPICGLNSGYTGGIETREIIPLPDRVERITARIQNWVALRRRPNKERRIVVIIYSYPPGDGNTGAASYLDTFASLPKILEKLRDEGYRVEIPEEPFHRLFDEKGLVNSSDWHEREKTAGNGFAWEIGAYGEIFASFPQEVQDDVIGSWGPPPGDIMVYNGSFLFPGIELGNILVAIQPARPPLTPGDIAKAAHDKTKPPHHQYIAFYRWLEEVWKADLVLHVGTHGLAEFTKGKEIGLSASCFPDLLIGNLPHLYYYTVVNTAEATIAKRRLYGTLISYNSPPFSTSGLYEEYLELEDLIAEHEEAERLGQHIREERTKEKIISLATGLHLGISSIPAIHEQLYEMKRSIIPFGLHIIGEAYSPDTCRRFIGFVLRYDREEIASLNRILAESGGLDYDEIIRERRKYVTILDLIDQKCDEVVRVLVEQGVEGAVIAANVREEERGRLARTLTYGLAISREYADNAAELANLIQGLNARFIPSRTGGDVIRNPDILPTGGNLLQFDPTKIPTETAVERGREIAEMTLAAYREREGEYPERVGVVLWGFETSSSGGETVGQILGYLGVRLKKRHGDWATRIEVIPLEDLGRPRIDCHISICGFFRDMFPNIMQMIDQAVGLVSGLGEPEEMNYVRRHSRENRESLEKQVEAGSIDRKTANQLSVARIFGPRSGEYGTRLLPLTEESVWKNESDLAEVYLSSVSHVYCGEIHGESQRDLYTNNLKSVALISQIRDRHDREVTDLDHYFEYFGGLNLAVKTVSGQSPLQLITDTTKEVVKTEGIRDAINRGIRTRLLNPIWIDAMLAHEFHGAQQIEDRVYVTLGFAATTHAVDDWVWSGIARKFVYDEEMRSRLITNNRFSALGIVKRLFEAEERGYWNATEEEREKLRGIYLEMEEDIEADHDTKQNNR